MSAEKHNQQPKQAPVESPFATVVRNKYIPGFFGKFPPLFFDGGPTGGVQGGSQDPIAHTDIPKANPQTPIGLNPDEKIHDGDSNQETVPTTTAQDQPESYRTRLQRMFPNMQWNGAPQAPLPNSPMAENQDQTGNPPLNPLMWGGQGAFGLPNYQGNEADNTGQGALDELLDQHPHLKGFRESLAILMLLGPDLVNTFINTWRANGAERVRNAKVEERGLQTQENANVAQDAKQALEMFGSLLSDKKFYNAVDKTAREAYGLAYVDLPAPIQLTVFQLTAGGLKASPENIGFIEKAMRDAMQKIVKLNLAADNTSALANFDRRITQEMLASAASGTKTLKIQWN